jgi:hypothetical protein
VTKTHKSITAEGRPYNSGEELFEPIAPREKFKSNRFMELVLDYSTDMSDRVAARRLNRMRHETDGIKTTTYRNTVEREGMKIVEHIEAKSEAALLENGFTSDGELQKNVGFKPEGSCHIPVEAIIPAMENLNIKKCNPGEYELPEQSINISADDVCVKRQTEIRPRKEDCEQPKRVDNTVIHVENEEGKYHLNASSLFSTLKMLIGFLLCNDSLKKQLVFFTDGAREIHNEIHRMFGFAGYKIILDWYHLEKKCKEKLSMALKGREIRNEFLKELTPCLWFGNVDGAVRLLENISPKKVKSHQYIDELIGYFGRVRDYLPCYALRKELGLRNSSNSGDKANDLIVSKRQKHNGMSWSDNGSLAFASVSAALLNGEIHNWIHSNDIGLAFVYYDAA